MPNLISYDTVLKQGNAVHCGASVRDLQGALVFHSTTSTDYVQLEVGKTIVM